MYRFLECTCGQYMTRSQDSLATRRYEEPLKRICKHDFNAFPVMEGKD